MLIKAANREKGSEKDGAEIIDCFDHGISLLRDLIKSSGVFFALALLALSASAVIIPPERRITWTGNVGVPTGITNRTAWTNMTLIDNTGSVDVTAAINYALAHVPGEQAVVLPAGTFKISSALIFKTNCTLRGAGPGNTIIDGHCTGSEVVALGINGSGAQDQYVFGNPGTPVNITSGTSLGSSNIVVSSASQITIGNFLCIDVFNDTNGFIGVSGIGNEGYQRGDARTVDRHLGQIAVVTAINGTTITIDPPLVWFFTNSPQATPFPCINKYAGVENLTVNNNNTGTDYCLSLQSCAYCWLTNVESEWADGDHIVLDSAVRCQVEHCYFHDAYSHSPGSHDSTLKLQAHTTGALFENNIMRRMHIGLMLNDSVGNVFGYNFLTNTFDSGSTLALYSDVTHHGAHSMMNLWEGNVLNSYSQDGIHGTGSHGTLLRNFISGQNWVCPPLTGRGAEQTNSYTKQYQYDTCIALAGIGDSKFFNIVGNVLGTTDMGNYPTYSPIYMVVNPTARFSDHNGYGFNLGYGAGSDGGGGAGDNTDPYDTIINHGNWDVVNSSQIFSNSIADHVIPLSYYLASKPSFFGTLNWPPIDPTTSGADNTAQITNVPPVYRYFNNSDPPSGASAAIATISGGVTLSGGAKLAQ